MRSALSLPHQKRLLVVGLVVGAHGLGLWAMQNGLVRRAMDEVVPILVMAELIDAPKPVIPPAPPPPAPVPPLPAPPLPQPVVKPAPRPAPTPAPAPVTEAPSPMALPEPPAPAAVSTPENLSQAAAPVPVAPPAPTPAPAPRIELPSSSADYLSNPPPPYPSLSKRLGEQGKVVVRVFISATGEATQAEIRTSSGFERLDQTALQTVLRWRYVPGKRNGVAEGMWFNVPIQFVLE
ncbi:MAG: energy transducer TonB [Hydrogenophaga sp.]